MVFLDVNMPEVTGVGVVLRLCEKDIDLPHFIFVTAYDQYAVEAFRLEAMDDPLKPVDKARLAETIERARRGDHRSRAAGKPAEAPGRAPSRAAHLAAGEKPTAATSSWMPRT